MLWTLLCGMVMAVGADSRAEVEEVLRRMNAAVLAGDKAAYLRYVDQRDPEFAMEQRHWADDLDRHVPLEFELSLVDEPGESSDDVIVGESRLEATLRMKYRSKVGHAAGERGKRALWPGVFTRHDPDGDGPQPEQWLYAGERWLEVSGVYGDDAAGTRGTFVVKHLAGSEKVAADVVEAFPVAKAHADEQFGINVTRPLQIKLYRSMEHLKAWVYLSMPDEILGGWNEPGESIKFMSNYTSGVDRWRGAFAHEYGHVATWELGPKVKMMPWWMAEGAAEQTAEAFTKSRGTIHRMMLRKWKNDALCTWDSIADYDKAEAGVKMMAYHQGQHLMHYVVDRWGREKRNEWIREVAHGAPLDEATTKVLGLAFAELDATWRAALESGAADPPLADPPLPAPPAAETGQKAPTPPGGG